MFVVVEWIGSKRSIFVLLVELSIALVHVLEKGWTAVVEERLQSWKVTEISCDRQDRISVSVVLFKVAYKTNHRSEVWSICEIYVLQFQNSHHNCEWCSPLASDGLMEDRLDEIVS